MWVFTEDFPIIYLLFLQGVYSLAFGTDAQSLFVGGGDHKLRIFGSSQ